MKKLVIIITLITISFAVNAQVEKVSIKTSAICEMCKYTIERDLTFQKGIKTADLDLETKVLTVEFSAKKTTEDKIRERITKVGYNADSLQRDLKAYNALPDCCKDGAHQDKH
jgi:mercuric ion binding protein